jgi:hypothetical protein
MAVGLQQQDQQILVLVEVEVMPPEVLVLLAVPVS